MDRIRGRWVVLLLVVLLLASLPAVVKAAPPGPAVVPGAGIVAASAAQTAPTAITSAQTFEQQVVYHTNLQRLSNGLLPLRYNPHLRSAAYSHSQDMALNDFFDHVGSDGSTLVTRAQDAGYVGWTVLAENIAAGFSDPQAVVEAWMNSPGHRANILRSTVSEIGVGYYFQADDQANVRLPDGSTGGPYFHYITQDFGARAGVYPVILAAEALTTTTPTVTLYAYGQGWATEMMIANDDPTFSGAQWQPFQPVQSWTLPATEGQHTVYARLRNAAGHGPQAVVESSDSIYLDLPDTASVAGVIFVDTDTDGVRDPGENDGLGGAQVALRDENGALVASTASDDAGFYSFSNLPPRVYTLEAAVGQLVATSPNPRQVTLVADTILTVDFGFAATTSLAVTTFTASGRPDAIELTWEVLHPTDPSEFTLERAKTAAGPYSPLPVVPTQEASQGDAVRYRALDTTVQRGHTYWYRLRLPTGNLVGPVSARLKGFRLLLPTVSRSTS